MLNRPSPKSILLVEDDLDFAESLVHELEAEGMKVELHRNAQSGGEALKKSTFDLIVLDRMLPDGDGLDMCRELRENDVTTPVVVVSALQESEERVAALDSGADDFMPKPLDLNELMARMRANYRRVQSKRELAYTYGDLRLDVISRIAERDGSRIRLSNKEFELLELFMSAPEQVQTRQEICEKVWDLTYYTNSNVLDVYISALRKKLDKPFPAPLLHTVVGVGYVLANEPPQ